MSLRFADGTYDHGQLSILSRMAEEVTSPGDDMLPQSQALPMGSQQHAIFCNNPRLPNTAQVSYTYYKVMNLKRHIDSIYAHDRLGDIQMHMLVCDQRKSSLSVNLAGLWLPVYVFTVRHFMQSLAHESYTNLWPVKGKCSKISTYNVRFMPVDFESRSCSIIPKP